MTFVDQTTQNNRIAMPIQPQPLSQATDDPSRLCTLNEMCDRLTSMSDGLDQPIAESKHASTMHIPGTWEVITQFFSNICRAIGSLFTRNH